MPNEMIRHILDFWLLASVVELQLDPITFIPYLYRQKKFLLGFYLFRKFSLDFLFVKKKQKTNREQKKKGSNCVASGKLESKWDLVSRSGVSVDYNYSAGAISMEITSWNCDFGAVSRVRSPARKQFREKSIAPVSRAISQFAASRKVHGTFRPRGRRTNSDNYGPHKKHATSRCFLYKARRERNSTMETHFTRTVTY